MSNPTSAVAMLATVFLFLSSTLLVAEATSRTLNCFDPTGFFCSSPNCPPEGFDSVPDLDIQKYIAAPWFIQQQMTNSYQPKSSLFCVRAKYELKDPSNIEEGLLVFNYANKEMVNGETMGDSMTLRALIPDPEAPSKLKVGPSFLEEKLGETVAKTLYGPYWVVAVGPSEDESLGYDWAIVSGGPPEFEGDDGCKTGSDLLRDLQVNGVGLWLFSRKPVDPENTEIMRNKARELGYDLSVLEPVVQEGCNYEGARA